MKDWFDLAAKRHQMIKEAVPLLAAAPAIGRMLGVVGKSVSKAPLKALGAAAVGAEVIGAARAGAHATSSARRAAQTSSRMIGPVM